MNNTNTLNITINDIIQATDKINHLEEKVVDLEDKLSRLEALNEDSWLSLSETAKRLGKTVSAVRQRLKHPTKPMLKGYVWKQESLGCDLCEY